MRVGMDMLLYPECLALLLEHHAKVNVQGRIIRAESVIVCILDISARILRIIRRHTFRDIFRVQILNAEKPSLAVHLRLTVPVPVDYQKGRHPVLLGDLVIIRTEGRGDMYDTSSALFRSHIVSGDDTESAFIRSEPRNQLLIVYPDQFRALERPFKNLERHQLVPFLIAFKRKAGRFRVENRIHQGLRHDIDGRITCIGIVG